MLSGNNVQKETGTGWVTRIHNISMLGYSTTTINFLSSITDLTGGEWTSQEEIGNAFITYFQQLFTTEGAPWLEDCIQMVNPRVTPKMNALLSDTFRPEEVDQALSQMHPLKSLDRMALVQVFTRSVGILSVISRGVQTGRL
jgi:hypothetical protein